MKDLIKNPIFYYVTIPLVIAMWPLLVWGVYLPKAHQNLQDETKQYKEAQKTITRILNLDPGRLDYAKKTGDSAEFDYVNAIESIASQFKILPNDYLINTGMLRYSKGQKSQNATVSLKEVDITRFAEFLSAMQLRWSNLRCDSVKITHKKGLKDSWDIDLKLEYYY